MKDRKQKKKKKRKSRRATATRQDDVFKHKKKEPRTRVTIGNV